MYMEIISLFYKLICSRCLSLSLLLILHSTQKAKPVQGGPLDTKQHTHTSVTSKTKRRHTEKNWQQSCEQKRFESIYGQYLIRYRNSTKMVCSHKIFSILEPRYKNWCCIVVTHYVRSQIFNALWKFNKRRNRN